VEGGVRAAAFDDPRFEPERLRAAARAVLAPLEQVTTDEELLTVWRERFERWLPMYWRRFRLPGVPGGWGAEVEIRELEIVTVRNAGGAEPLEAVVRARLRVRSWARIGPLGPLFRALSRRRLVMWLMFVAPPGEDWRLTRADFNAAGEYHREAETVPEPARDPALRDAAIHELAKEEPVADPGELIMSTEGDAVQRLLDLSLADPRFAPAVVAASVRSLIRAWRRFAIGDEDAYHAFAALSRYDIAEYARSADLPARLHAIKVLAFVPSPRPALFLEIEAIVQGSDGARDRNLCWQLELDDELDQHWRLVDAYARPELRALGRPAHSDLTGFAWRLTEDVARSLEAELQEELAPGHALHGRRAVAIAKRETNDDVLFALQDSREVALVHLTWARRRERPPWPTATIYGSIEEFRTAAS